MHVCCSVRGRVSLDCCTMRCPAVSDRGEEERLRLELFLSIVRNLLMIPNPADAFTDAERFLQDRTILMLSQVYRPPTRINAPHTL